MDEQITAARAYIIEELDKFLKQQQEYKNENPQDYIGSDSPDYLIWFAEKVI